MSEGFPKSHPTSAEDPRSLTPEEIKAASAHLQENGRPVELQLGDIKGMKRSLDSLGRFTDDILDAPIHFSFDGDSTSPYSGVSFQYETPAGLGDHHTAPDVQQYLMSAFGNSTGRRLLEESGLKDGVSLSELRRVMLERANEYDTSEVSTPWQVGDYR